MSNAVVRPVATAALLASVFSFGLGWHFHPDTKTETKYKIVKVPDTHVVEKKTTKVVKPELPESCKQITDELRLLEQYSRTMTEATGNIKIALPALGNAIFAKDVRDVNMVILAVQENKKRLDTAANDLATVQTDIKNQTDMCDADIAKLGE